jgi:uncharacterized protein YlxW (UPF0749 family)
MKRWQVALSLGIVCCILTLAISIQLKTIDNARENANIKVSLTLTSNELRDQVLKWKEKYDNEVKALEESEKKLEEARLKSTQNDENAILKEEEIKKDNIILGLTDVTGNGIILTLKDNNNVSRATISPIDNIELYLVHASDIVAVLNDLKNAGAEAISINGQRIVETTSVYCAGNVLKVNEVKISSPIEIKAIGEPDLLYGSMNIPGGYLELMRDTGIDVTIKKADNIQIEKYDGVIKATEMKNE